MGIYHLNLDKLSEYTSIAVDDLKQKSYAELESMIKKMEEDKILERNNRNAEDEEYERLVLKYFIPLNTLHRYFDDKEIVLACASTGVTENDLCSTVLVAPGGKCPYSNSEYIRTSVERVKQFDGWGRELAETKQQKMDVYRVANQYQGLCHGDAILHLLYERYPELKKFKFSAYSMDWTTYSADGYEPAYDYEIYPENGVYVPLAALMSGDIDAIMFRNREYAKWYNHGDYTIDECEKRFLTEEVQEMFAIIHNIGKQERKAGHLELSQNAKGVWVDADGLRETDRSRSGNVIHLQESINPSIAKHNPQKKRRFRLKCLVPMTVKTLVTEYVGMLHQNDEVFLKVYDEEDYAGESGITLEIKNSEDGASLPVNFVKDGVDVSNRLVCGTFGWSHGKKSELTIRISRLEIRRQLT